MTQPPSTRWGLRRVLLSPLSALADSLFRLVGSPYRLNHLQLERHTVHIPGLPPHLAGYTIGVLSDLHLGPLVAAREVRKAADLLAAARPDLVVVAGDLISEHAAIAWLPEALAPLAGAYGVLGNWDYRHDDGAALRAQNTVRILVNRGVQPAPGLWLAGLDDSLYGRPNIHRALAGAPPGAVRILLSHEPDAADRIRPRDRIALQISGHSHGGQIRLPFGSPLLLPAGGRKYPAGFYDAPACRVYTSRGVGVAHLPLRLWCPPEVSLLTLEPDQPSREKTGATPRG